MMVGAGPIAINGKFLGASSTGVHRVAAELANALAALPVPPEEALDVQLWIPHDCTEQATHIALPPRVLRPLTYIPWEQLSTPFRDRGRLLVNFCNLGPALRRNCVTMIHDAQVHLTPGSYSKAFRIWYKTLQAMIGKRHRAILTVSEFSRREIARAGICPIDRITVIPNGVDHMLRTPSEPKVLDRLGLAERAFVVGLASSQTHKNIGLLLRAFARPELADLPLVLIGTGSAEAFAAQGLDLPANVLFTGRISDEELRGLYEAALCLAFPSLTEGFGLPPLEAMLLGCPAVVAPCGAVPEMCGEAALYGAPDDPAEWARLIRSLADQPDLRDRYVALGRERAAGFTWERAARTLFAVLARLHAGQHQTSNIGPVGNRVEAEASSG